MKAVYRCYCFAIPSKLLRKLAEKVDEKDRSAIHDHIKTTSQLRVGRNQLARRAVAPLADQRAELPPYQRTVFDADRSMALPGQPVRVEGDRPVKDRAANQAYDNTGLTLDFFRAVFGRHSIDNRGMPVHSAVHFGENYANAMWTGEQMVYGDGDHQVGGFTEAIDIIAHELSHGVTQHMVPGGLGVARLPLKERAFKEQTHALKGQSGALNESFSDVVGSMVKQWHAGHTVKQASWLMGENMLAPEHGKAIRSLKDPGNRRLTWYEDDQVKSMDDYVEGADVHDSSGIPNHAFYLTASRLGGCSWEKAGPIWYDAWSTLQSKSTFKDAAKATAAAAKQRFGAQSPEHLAVTAAWQAVKVMP